MGERMRLEHKYIHTNKIQFLNENHNNDVIDKNLVNQMFENSGKKISKEQAENFLLTLSCETLHLFRYISMYLDILKCKNEKQEIIMQGLGFFSTAEEASKELIILTISRICDKNSNIGNLEKYLYFLKWYIFNEIKNGNDLKFEYNNIYCLEKEYEKYVLMISEIKDIRNKYIAHNDGIKSFLNNSKETNIQIELLKDFLFFCYDLVAFSTLFYKTNDDLSKSCYNCEPKLFSDKAKLKEIINLKRFSEMWPDLEIFINNIQSKSLS